MKTILALVLVLAASLSGCSAINQLPPGACTRYEHTGNYGPFLQTHVVMQGVVKTPDGGLTVASYDGDAKVQGFGPSDHIEGLYIEPALVAKAQAKLAGR